MILSQRIPNDYSPIESLPVDIKCILKGFDNFIYLLVVICENTIFMLAMAIKTRAAQGKAEALSHKVI